MENSNANMHSMAMEVSNDLRWQVHGRYMANSNANMHSMAMEVSNDLRGIDEHYCDNEMTKQR